MTMIICFMAGKALRKLIASNIFIHILNTSDTTALSRGKFVWTYLWSKEAASIASPLYNHKKPNNKFFSLLKLKQRNLRNIFVEWETYMIVCRKRNEEIFYVHIHRSFYYIQNFIVHFCNLSYIIRWKIL